MIKFRCRQCNAILQAADFKAGARTKCPLCWCPVQIPGSARTAAGNSPSPSDEPFLPMPVPQLKSPRSPTGLVLLLGLVFTGGMLVGALVFYLGMTAGRQQDREPPEPGRALDAAGLGNPGDGPENPAPKPPTDKAPAKPPAPATPQPDKTKEQKPPG